MSCLIEVAGTTGCTARINGVVATSVMGAKSRVRLYLRSLYITDTITACDVMITSVYPSGGDFAAISAPTMPVAPGRGSTITCCPHASVSLLPTRRPTMSGPEPGELSAMMRIGLTGYSCARHAGARIAARLSAAIPRE